MAGQALSPELLQFISEHVRSVEHLETLCWFHEHPETKATVAEVFRVIQSSPDSVTNCLELFRKSGLLVADPPGTYQLNPNSPELAQKLTDLARAYRERRVTVIESIYRRPATTLQNFADAFRLRKEPSND